jgi:hypothetical protein
MDREKIKETFLIASQTHFLNDLWFSTFLTPSKGKTWNSINPQDL